MKLFNNRLNFNHYFAYGLVSILSLVALTSCNSKDESESNIDKLVPQAKLQLLNTVSFDLENSFFDGFDNGVNYDNWYIGNGAWGNGNGGVISDNVFFSQNGELILRGNGRYYAKGEVKGVGSLKDGRNTGAALISKRTFTPGRFEIKMKPLPRQGACTAFWTYANTPSESGENLNHEIDIELPGGKSNGMISFKNVLNTNYITETLNESQDMPSFLGEITTYLNDGNYHVFGFDWYTNPNMIVYYIDGYITSVSTNFIPDLETRLWFGCWFPNNAGFVGDSFFETDYMYVDYVKYLAFDSSQTYTPHNPSISVNGVSINQYPTNPTYFEEANKVSNGDFEYAKNSTLDLTEYGWSFRRKNVETKPVEEVCYISNVDGNNSLYAANVVDGGYLIQEIDSVYENFKYKLTFDAKTTSNNALARVYFYDATSNAPLDSVIINIDKNSEYQTYTQEVIAPSNSYYMSINFVNNDNSGTTSIDNVEMVKI
ncbi:MAG: family 16 glycosylhydrolase [Bacilli bacterium]